MNNLAQYLASNVSTTANLLDALHAVPPRQFIYVSTLSVCSLGEAQVAQETGPARNDIPYLVTKRCSEQLAEGFQSKSRVVVLRLPSLYGAGQTDSFIDGLARMAKDNQTIELFSRGETVRDALHVEDAVSAIIACLTCPPEVDFCAINLGCGQRVTTRNYVEALVQALDSSSEVIPVDRPSPQQIDLQADITDARRLIGFSPTPLSASMERYARELQAQL